MSASGDQTLKVWDAHTGEERLTLRGHTDMGEWVRDQPSGRLYRVSFLGQDAQGVGCTHRGGAAHAARTYGLGEWVRDQSMQATISYLLPGIRRSRCGMRARERSDSRYTDIRIG